MKTVNYREYNKAIRELRIKLREQTQSNDIEIYEMNFDGFNGEPIQLGINWPSIGTVDAASAKDFAAAIIKATELIENFTYNGYLVEY